MRERLAAGLAALLAAMILMPAASQALTPERPLAKLAYSNGGRILAMNVDGTGRKVIFGKERNPTNDYLGALEPVSSPDGETIAFGFKRQSRINDLFDIWTVGSDGSGARRILKSNARVQYGDPTFMPGGRLMVAFFRENGRRSATGLISIGIDGGDRKTEFRTTQRRRPYVAPKMVMEPDVDRRGKRVAYVLNDGFAGNSFDEGFNNPLMVLDLASGKSRKVAANAYEAVWSPRGDRIAFTRQTDDDDLMTCWWASGCEFTSALAIVKADGSGLRIVNGRRLDERSPDWSSDNRIIFHSARNLPGTGEASEIWSVTPDGRCLTPLTNGSPASLTPAWMETGPATSAPAECGEAPAPTRSVRMPASLSGRGGLLWMGQQPGTRLLSDAGVGEAGAQFLYYDCVRQNRADCRKPAGVWNVDVCTYRGFFAPIYGESGQARWQRGTRVFVDRGSEMGPFNFLVAGRSVTFFFGGTGKGAQLGRTEVDQLRTVREETPSGDLPSARFPAGDIKQMKRVAGIFEANGSVRGTARRTGLSPGRVRDNLRFARTLKSHGDYSTVNCGT